MSQAQIKKIKSLVNLLADKWRILHLRTMLLEPALLSQTLVKRMKDEGKLFSFEAIRITLAEAVILAASALLYGYDKNDISLSNFIPHLRRNLCEIYSCLRAEYMEPLPFEWSDSDPALSEETKKEMCEMIQVEERERKSNFFDEKAKTIVAEYDSLTLASGYGSRIKKVRDKVVAHYGTKAGTSGDRIVTMVEDYGLKISELLECVNKIEDLAVDCELLFCNSSFIVEDVKKHHMRAANEYWAVDHFKDYDT